MRKSEGEARGGAGSLAAGVALAGGLLAPVSAVMGALLANGGMLTPYDGFRLFLTSIPLALVAVLAGVFALLRARNSPRAGIRRRALGGLVPAVLTVSAILGLALPTVGLPIINDITTDVNDPPTFVHAETLPGNAGTDMAYHTDFAAKQEHAYPSIEPLDLDMPTPKAFERALRAVKGLGNVRVTDVVPQKGRIEATVTSRIFRFTDDVVVRVRRHGTGSRVDIRSRSRDGKGDLGANAARIELLIAAIR
jgi:uncharacterized protein (DUF1499 family)